MCKLYSKIQEKVNSNVLFLNYKKKKTDKKTMQPNYVNQIRSFWSFKFKLKITIYLCLID